MARLTPYIRFNGNCREALEFYANSLGGETWIQTIGESPMAGDMPPEFHGRVLHGEATAGEMKVMGTDLGNDMSTEGDLSGGPLTLCINGTGFDQLKGYFDALAAGGEVTNPLKEEFFGVYGDLTDKYGIRWMFQGAPPAQG